MKEVGLGVLVGVFLGAVVFEIISRKQPNIIKDVEAKAAKIVDSFVDSFKEGYQKATAES
jgi:hypothetical protein